MQLKNTLAAKAGFVIRKPVATVFDAFVNPQITTKFWIKRSTGPLEDGATVRWYFTDDISTEVRVVAIEKNRRIHFEWGDEPQDTTTVEWLFEPRGEDRACVNVSCSGFSGDADAMVAKALDTTSGFAIVLTAAKAYLEHGVQLDIVADHA